MFYISSRLIANDIETIEIPFETNTYSRREGSIIVRLLPSFPRKRPDVFVLFSSVDRTTTRPTKETERRGRGSLVLQDHTVPRQEIKEEERIEFAWGEPHIRLVTVVSDIWASLGCVESPRKKAFRQREEENRALNRLELHSDRYSMDRLGFAFYGQSGASTQGGSRIVSPVRRAQGEDSLGLGRLALDDDDDDPPPCGEDSPVLPEIPFGRVESFVRSMSKDAVVAALSSRAEFDRILGEGLGEFGRAEEIRQRVIDIARKNIELATEVRTLKQQVAIQRSEYDEKMAEFRKRHARQENARAGFGPESLIQQLYMSIDESNRKVSLLVERWKRREISNDVFVREYIEHMSVSHARAMKYQWAKESIPIPIQSNMH